MDDHQVFVALVLSEAVLVLVIVFLIIFPSLFFDYDYAHELDGLKFELYIF